MTAYRPYPGSGDGSGGWFTLERRNAGAQFSLFLGVLMCCGSIVTIWSYAFLVAPASMPFFIAGMTLRPSRAHVIISALGLAWAFMWIAFVLHDYHEMVFDGAARILGDAC